MTLKQILYVRAVSKAGSIGKAAESLFISQSSLSESIRNLEREYGMVLFERTSKGISLTRQGEAFLKDTQLLTNIYQDLDDKYKNHKGECEYFCVSSLHHVSGIDAFEHIVCQPKNQKYHLGYFEGNMDQVLQDVETNRSDIGVLFFTSDSRSAIIKACNRRNIFFQHLKYDLLHIYIQNTHPLAECKSVHWRTSSSTRLFLMRSVIPPRPDSRRPGASGTPSSRSSRYPTGRWRIHCWHWAMPM